MALRSFIATGASKPRFLLAPCAGKTANVAHINLQTPLLHRAPLEPLQRSWSSNLRKPAPQFVATHGSDAGAHAFGTVSRRLHVSSFSQSSSSSSSSSGVAVTLPGTVAHISKERLEALLESEIVHFARALEPHPMSVQEILHYRDAQSLRFFLMEELPIRFARRLDLIESLPNWKRFPHIRVIRSLYSDAFRRLRMVSGEDANLFRTTLTNIKRRNSNVLTHAVRGIRSMERAGQLNDSQVDDFLRQFLTARIGTDILSSQYLAITRPAGATTVIDPQCDPVEVVRAAARDAVRLCRYHYGYSPPVDVIDVGQVRFPFIPQYLNYIMFELIKNALRAVTERYDSEADACEHPINVVVCGDAETVVIRVSDEGGGIPLESLSKVWSYLYTTANPHGEDLATSDFDSDDETDVAPMAGFGCGLPLSRNYASYVGGRLELSTMPHHGVDAYVYFNRVGDSKEVFESKHEVRLPSRGLIPR